MMKVFVFVIAALAALPAIADEAAPKVTLEVKDAPVRQVLDSLTKQTGVPVVAVGEMRTALTLNLTGVPLEQAVTTIASLNNLRWKKVEFAMAKDSVISAEEIAKAIAVLDSVQMLGVAIPDKEKKTQTVFGKGLPVASLPQLPDGCKWQSVYILQKPEEPVQNAELDKPASPEEATAQARQRLDALNRERFGLFSSLPPEERLAYVQQEFYGILQLDPTLRQDVFRGIATAMRDLDDQARHDFFHEIRNVFGDRRGGPR